MIALARATATFSSSVDSVVVDAILNVYVGDPGTGVIQVFDSSGAWQSQWLDLGSTPSGLALDGLGNVYVADNIFDQVRVFTTAGTFETAIGSGHGNANGQFKNPYGVAFRSPNLLYVADTFNNRIQQFSLAELTGTPTPSTTATATITSTSSPTLSPTVTATRTPTNTATKTPVLTPQVFLPVVYDAFPGGW